VIYKANRKFLFHDELFAVPISMRMGVSCGHRAPSVILLSMGYRALCHLIPFYHLSSHTISYSLSHAFFPQPMLSDRPSPGGLWRFLNTAFAPELLGKHPQPAAPAPLSVQRWFMPGLTRIAWVFLTGHPAVGGLSPGF